MKSTIPSTSMRITYIISTDLIKLNNSFALHTTTQFTKYTHHIHLKARNVYMWVVRQQK